MALCLAWLVANILIFSKIRRSIDTPLSPFEIVCELPITSSYWSGWPCNSPRSLRVVVGVVDFHRLSEAEGDFLQNLLEESIGISEVVWDLWRSDITIGDLMSHAHRSSLKPNDPLLDTLHDLQHQIRDSMITLRAVQASINISVKR